MGDTTCPACTYNNLKIKVKGIARLYIRSVSGAISAAVREPFYIYVVPNGMKLSQVLDRENWRVKVQAFPKLHIHGGNQ